MRLKREQETTSSGHFCHFIMFFDNVAIIFVNSAKDFDCIMFKSEVTFVNKFSA